MLSGPPESISRVRDLILWETQAPAGLVIASDNVAGIAALPQDRYYCPPEDVGYFTARVVLFELLAAPNDHVMRGDPEMCGFDHLDILSRLPGIHELVPVGSGGARSKIAAMAPRPGGLRTVPEPGLDGLLDRSGGPATALVVAASPEAGSGPLHPLPQAGSFGPAPDIIRFPAGRGYS